MSINLNSNAKCIEEAKWTAKMVETYFEEVISTIKKLPPVVIRGYFNSWPDIIHSPNELIFQEKKPIRRLATPEAISRMEKTFEWMTWLEVEERKLIWKRAAKVRWKTICWELGCSRATVWKRWLIACTKIATNLNAKQHIKK